MIAEYNPINIANNYITDSTSYLQNRPQPQVKYLKTNAIEQLASIPNRWMSKLMLGDRQVSVQDSTKFSPRTKELIEQLAKNNPDIAVRVGNAPVFESIGRALDGNTYLYKNKYLRPFGGFFSAINGAYGKFTGGDYFDPYSNTVVVRSNIPAIAAHEIGHSLDFKSQRHPFLYATVTNNPVGSLLTESEASHRAGEMLPKNVSTSILTPAYSTYLGAALASIVATSKMNVPKRVVASIPIATLLGAHLIKKDDDWRPRVL